MEPAPDVPKRTEGGGATPAPPQCKRHGFLLVGEPTEAEFLQLTQNCWVGGGVGVPSRVAFVVCLNWSKHTYHRNEVLSVSGCVLESATFVFN